jgi:hypothetical protein
MNKLNQTECNIFNIVVFGFLKGFCFTPFDYVLGWRRSMNATTILLPLFILTPLVPLILISAPLSSYLFHLLLVPPSFHHPCVLSRFWFGVFLVPSCCGWIVSGVGGVLWTQTDKNINKAKATFTGRRSRHTQVGHPEGTKPKPGPPHDPATVLPPTRCRSS